jgi:hypothetical protein
MPYPIPLCAVCGRQAHGFGWVDTTLPVGTSFRENSRRCQDIGVHRQPWVGTAMIDPTPLETAALIACLKPFGECATEIGFHKPLSVWSREEALRLVEVIVTAFQDEMTRYAAGERQ